MSTRPIAIVVAFLVFQALIALPVSGLAQTPAPLAVIDGPPSADKLEMFFRGTWLVTVPGQQRTRQTVIRGVRSDGDRFVLDAFHGWSDVKPPPATASARVEGGVVVVEITHPSGVRLDLKSTGDDRLDGTIRYPSGKGDPASQERASASTELRTVSNTPAAVLPPGAPVKADDIERLLWGAWMVTVGNIGRTRTMVVRSVQEESGRFAVETVFGWTDGDPKPAPMTVSVEQGIVTLDFVTIQKARIVAKSISLDRYVGTLTGTDGKELPVKLILTGDDGVAFAARAASAAPAARPKQLEVIYVSATNCPKCSGWNIGYGSQPEMGKYAFLGTPEGKAVKFHHLTVGNYMNTAQDQDWPEELRWVRDKAYVKAGAPRFILISDNKVVANTTGSLRLRDIIVPKIRELADLKK